jgi:hypothetical protein
MRDRLNRRSIFLGLPVVVLSTVVGTGAFASLQRNAHIPNWARVGVGVIGMLAAVLASAQTFLGYAQRSERHRVGSVRYETLRRDMAEQIALGHPKSDAQVELNSVRNRMEKYAKESPPIPERTWRRLCRQFDIEAFPPPIE